MRGLSLMMVGSEELDDLDERLDDLFSLDSKFDLIGSLPCPKSLFRLLSTCMHEGGIIDLAGQS
jgi:hypothetical protein